MLLGWVLDPDVSEELRGRCLDYFKHWTDLWASSIHFAVGGGVLWGRDILYNKYVF